ncbi:MAG: hypothetical protein IPK26_03230 [Planctomycetes bacterium]|nr:hypothetical protein [Planctomycetota bacterium]
MTALLASAWSLLLVLFAATGWLVADATPIVRMFALVGTALFGLKAVVLVAAAADGAPRLPLRRQLCFLLWFGMNPRVFARRLTPDSACARRWALLGTRYLLLGVALVPIAGLRPGAAGGAVVMVALSFAVHFGVFTLLAAAMRAVGFRVPLLFDAPWRAQTAAEFWSVRWNHGFTEMTALAVQRPLARRIGRDRALLVSFLVSGLLHEVVLSWPVYAGWGLPTLYFLVQGLGVLWQRERQHRLVTLALIVLPLPLLFHPWFVAGVATPIAAAFGS